MCGVLYGLDKGREADGRIAFAFDLYERRELPVSVDWYLDLPLLLSQFREVEEV